MVSCKSCYTKACAVRQAPAFCWWAFSFWPPHKFPLAGLLTPGENTLTLTLTGSPANRYGKHPVPYGLER